MKIEEGVHLYININNLNAIVRKEESKHDDLKRTFHALNTWISTIEKFGKDNENFYPEKFTTSRLHFYFKYSEDICDDSVKMIEMAVFANKLASELTTIGKYKEMVKFEVGVGMDLGVFTEFNFEDDDSEIEEMTTIGSPANRAAKLQSRCEKGKILISSKIYEVLPENVKLKFFDKGENLINVASKYADLRAYEADCDEVREILGDNYISREENAIEWAKEKANETDLKDIYFSDAKKQVDFSSLSLKNSKDVEKAVVLYSDIRGFTNKVDHGKLSEMKILTQKVLQGMYSAVKKEDGTHVQFQGDRESAIFNSLTDKGDFALRAIFSGMRILDKIEEINDDRSTDKLNVGIGCAVGRVFATRVGLRGDEKFNVILSETVKEADTAEDEVAGVEKTDPKTELVITKDLYDYIAALGTKEANNVKALFKERTKQGKKYYTTTKRMSDYRNDLEEKNQKNNAQEAKNNYGIKPWGVMF